MSLMGGTCGFLSDDLVWKRKTVLEAPRDILSPRFSSGLVSVLSLEK